MLGFLLERLGKLPVGHAKFAGKGVEARVWNLDLEGVHVKRENVDLVMKGFRLPKRCVFVDHVSVYLSVYLLSVCVLCLCFVSRLVCRTIRVVPVTNVEFSVNGRR